MTFSEAPAAGPVRRVQAMLVIALVFVASPLRGDEIVTGGGVKFERVRIVELEGWNLAYRTPTGEYRTIAIGDVARLTVDTVGTLGDLNEAEQHAAGGDWARSLSFYERSARVATDFWERIVRVRFIRACEGADRVDELARQAVALLKDEATGAAALAAVIPDGAMSADSRGVERAMRTLDDAVGRVSSQSARVVLDALRFQLANRAGLAESAALARGLVEQPIPPAAGSRQLYRARAAAVVKTALAGVGDALHVLNADIDAAPMSVLPELLMAKARLLEDSAADDEGRLAAASVAMRVVIHFANDEQAPDALLLAARVHDRIGRAPTAARLVEECLSHKWIATATRDEAVNLAARLGGDG